MAKIVGKGHNTWSDGSRMTYTITDDGVLTVSGCLNFGYVRIKAKAKFHHLVIDEGVTEVRGLNFRGMEAIEELTLPASLTNICVKAFCGCKNLKRIHFSEGLLLIGEAAFEECEALTEVRLPDTVTSIGKEAFYNCVRLAKVKLPKNLKKIEKYTFFHCSSLRKIKIPQGLTTIEVDAFRFCDALEEISVPRSVQEIWKDSFDRCDKLQSVIRQDGHVVLGGEFVVEAPDGMKYECQISNIHPEKSKTSIRSAYPYEPEGELVVPECVEYNGQTYKVTTIAAEAFRASGGLTSVVLPDSVESIEYEAFAQCTKLKSVKNAQSIKTIDSHAFSYCEELEELELGDELEMIGNYAFDYCGKLKLVDSRKYGLIYVHNVLYQYHGYLPPHSWIEVRKGTIGIAEDALYGKRNLEGVVLPDGLKMIGYHAFVESENLKFANLPKSLVFIGEEAFYYTSIKEVTAPWRKPIDIGYRVFPKETVVYVPKGTLNAYAEAKNWKNYKLVEK